MHYAVNNKPYFVRGVWYVSRSIDSSRLHVRVVLKTFMKLTYTGKQYWIIKVEKWHMLIRDQSISHVYFVLLTQ